MPPLCRHSEIRIPNDPAFAPAAARYVVEVARLIGFEEAVLHSIDQGVRMAITELIRYSFEPSEQADLVITCEHIPEGLKVTLLDKGLPFGSAERSTQGPVCWPGNHSVFCAGILGLKELFDDIRLSSLGPEGKETVLIKHLRNSSAGAYPPACDLPTQADIAPVDLKPQWQVRQVLPEEIPEISRLVYQVYGYAYPHEYVYYPEKVETLNAAGKIHSAVALADGKEIGGQCIMQFEEDNPRIAELAQAVVKPKYRSLGCLKALTDYLLQVGEENGLRGLFTKSVTEHPFSQKTAHRSGFRDSALLLGMIPRNTPFKGLSGPLTHRGTLLLQFRYLYQVSQPVFFAPPGHGEMIAKIFAHLGIAPSMRSDSGSAVPAEGRSRLRTEALGPMQFARLVMERSGSDGLERVRTELRELRMHGFEVIHLYLNLGDPNTIHLAGEFEELGFFFSGLMPEAFPDGHALILQLLNGAPVDYEAVKVESLLAGELLAYIRAQDPNR